MSMWDLPRLLELAGQSLLENEALAIGALEELPRELFPPLFMAAYAGRCRETLKAMVQAWPFAWLPLGPLMQEWELHQETIQAVLTGLDMLLAQEFGPRKRKLQVLDLRKNAHRHFWPTWSGTTADLCSLMESDAAQPMKKQKVNVSWMGAEQPQVSVEVIVDLCLKEGSDDEFLLTSLIEKVKQRKGLLHLSCKNLKIFQMPMQNIKMILKMVQLDSVQDLEVNCTWKLTTLGKFAPHLGQMANLHRFVLSHIHMSSSTSLEKEEQCINQFTSQFLRLHHLQELYLDSVSFLKGRLNVMLRCLACPLESLSITNCVLSESDLTYLSQCSGASQLKELGLSGVTLTDLSLEPLQVLLEKVSATLQDLDLDECGIMDTQFSALLPALSQCSQLTTFSFCGNPISMAVLEDLLRRTIRLTSLRQVLYPAPLESYEDAQGIPDPGRLTHLHARLKRMLRELGQSTTVWFTADPCPHCGDRA